MSLPALQKYHKEAYPAISPSRPELDQSGKTIVIAGASSGIGYAIARAFVAAGSKRIIILGRRRSAVEAAATTLNRESPAEERHVVEGRAVDIANLEDTAKLWSDLETDGIYVDTLVLNAAAFGKSTPILKNGFTNVWADFETNVRAPLQMTTLFYNQNTGQGQKFLVNVSTIAAYMWSTMGPERPTYGLTKNANTALMQQIAKDISPEEMQIVSFHPGGVLTQSARDHGFNEDSGLRFDNENLPGNFAVWAASSEATFLHGRFVWANWDVDELKHGVYGKQIQEDEHFLKVGIEGLTEKTGGMII